MIMIMVLIIFNFGSLMMIMVFWGPSVYGGMKVLGCSVLLCFGPFPFVGPQSTSGTLRFSSGVATTTCSQQVRTRNCKP